MQCASLDLDWAGLERPSARYQQTFASERTLPQEPQVLVSPLMPAPHLGQLSLWELTMTVVDCILAVCSGSWCLLGLFVCRVVVEDSFGELWRGKWG